MRLGFPFLLLSLRSLFLCCALTDPFDTVSPFYSHLSLVSSVLLSSQLDKKGERRKKKEGGQRGFTPMHPSAVAWTTSFILSAFL